MISARSNVRRRIAGLSTSPEQAQRQSVASRKKIVDHGLTHNLPASTDHREHRKRKNVC